MTTGPPRKYELGDLIRIRDLPKLSRGGNSKIWDNYNGMEGVVMKVLPADELRGRRVGARITSGFFKGQHIGFLEEQNLMPIEMKID